MFSKLPCLGLLLVVAGCAVPRGIESPEKIAAIRSVTVISSFEDKFGFGYTGFTVFNNKSMLVPVDWHMGDYTRYRIVDALRQRYEIRQPGFDPRAFTGVNTGRDEANNAATALTARLKEVAKPGQVDAYLIVISRFTGSLASRNIGPSELNTYYSATVFDGHTLEPIAQAASARPCRQAVCLLGYERLSQTIPLPWNGEAYETLQPFQKELLRKTVMQLIDESIPFTLQRLKLLSAGAN